MRTSPRKLGIYSDGPYRTVDLGDGPRVAPSAADFPFLSFAAEVGTHFDGLLLFGRNRSEGTDASLVLPPHVRLAPLPDYDLRRPGQVARAAVGTLAGFWRGLSEVDAVWVFGPHPFSFLLLALAALRRKRIVLGVRQDTVAYFRGRLPSGSWRPALLAVRALDAGYRAVARATRATVVGREIARRYGGGRRLLPITVSLLRGADVVPQPRARDWNGRVDLFTVGRLDQEKNPLLLVEVMAALERTDPGRYHLWWAGTGPLDAAVRARAEELEVSDRIELLGFVPFGPELLERYRRAHAFVHVSLTEGVPAVLMEALGSGTPVVATDVGGVRRSLEDGRAGLLVPPADLAALLGAIRRLRDDPELRESIVSRGLILARQATLEAQAERVAHFIRRGSSPR